MESESFYGITLSDKESIAQFESNDSEYLINEKLIIKQICLGAEAKQGEMHVIQAETRVGEKKSLKIPIAVLKVGETRALKPNLEFPGASVTFKLIQGTGPVYIYGQHIISEMGEEHWHGEDEEDIEEDYEDEGPPPQTNGKNGNKRK